MDVGTWLRGLGLERYVRAFRDAEVTPELLAELTDADLRELGLPLGPRRVVLRAIRDLAASPAPAVPEETGSATPPTAAGAERRQLTVMLVGLVGSTALSARLDPEDLRQVLRAYRDAVAGAITRFEGHVAKFMGDAILAYFGYPLAHEDEAERAVRAGLAILPAVGEYRTPGGEALAPRIGIATGLVVVGELVGEGAAREQAVVGETPNLAARLQALADPGALVIAESTRRLLGGLFELRDLGTHVLRGFAEPVRGWHVLGESGAESRFEASHAAGLTPLVGREEEVGLLLRRGERAREGEGQVVVVSGEPGLGKSRLIRAVRERLDSTWMPLSHYCSPHHQTTALHPAVGLLERAAGFARNDTPERRLAKLEALLGQATVDPAAAAPLFAGVLGIPTGDRYLPLALSPQRQKQMTLEALLAQLEGLAARQPVLAVYEDVHWADPTSLELLDLVVERVQRLRVLVLITSRPEFRPTWTGHAHVSALTLNRLDRRRGTMLIERVTGKALPPELVDQIAAKTDGVPLFVEELTKAVLESGLLRDAGDRYVLTGPLPPLAIPSTLHDSLLARLDRLAPVKEVAQIGAAFGREFSHELLAAVAPMRDDELRQALDRLVAAELIFRRGTPPEASYVFKHALVRDTAYGTLLKSRRQQLHARIVQVLEERLPATAEAEPELLAQHCTEAGLAEQAVGYWYRAGQRALGRSATAEAVAQLSRGREVLASLPDGPERWEKELRLEIALGGALIAAEGYAAPQTGRAYARAQELCGQLGRSAELFSVLRGQWNCHFVRGELRRAHELAERLVALAAEQDESLHRALAQRALGSTLLFLGRPAEAAEQLERGIVRGDAAEASEGSRAHLLLYAERASLVCRLYLARSLWLLGFPDRALATVEAGLELSGGLAHPHSLAFALNTAAVVLNCRREFEAARIRAEAAIAVASEHRLPQWLAMGRMCRGFALAGLGEPADGIEQLHAGLAGWNGTGARLDDTHWLGLTAAAHIAAGRFADAFATLDRAAQTAAATAECYYEPELQRLRGALLMRRDEKEAWLRRAIEAARRRGAKSLELRAATSLARLWQDKGERHKAHDLLTPIYGWFTEGFDTPDLRDARTLLDQVQ